MRPVQWPARPRERGGALVVVVLLTAALTIAAGAVALFAMVEARVAGVARERVAVAVAVEAGLELMTAAIAAEPDLDAVRAGIATPPPSGSATHRAAGLPIDVATRTLGLQRRRASLPPPAGTAAWRPYFWGRVTELLGDGEGDGPDRPWIVAWIRSDDASGLGRDRLEVAVEASGTGGARAGAIAVVERRAGGAALVAAWPDVGLAAPE